MIIVDNISSLMPEAAKGSPKFFYDFIKLVKEIGISMLIVHHANKSGDVRGDNTIINLSKTIFVAKIISKDNLDDISHLYIEDVKKSLSIGRTLVQLSIKKWKNSSSQPTLILKHDTEKYSLDLRYGSWDGDVTKATDSHCSLQSISNTIFNPIVDDQKDTLTGEVINLSPNDQKIFELILNNKKAYRKDIEEKTKLSRDTVLGCLKRLRLEGLISANGKGKGTFYTIAEHYTDEQVQC